MRSIRAFILSLVCIAFAAVSSLAADGNVIDGCQYADNASAQAVWQPMGGTAPASVALMDGRQTLRLACNFAGTKIERASWDRPGKLDLASGRGIRFDVLCRDASPVSYFSIYFQSGDGWYHGTFYPDSTTDWNTIVMDKTDMRSEGKPAGWGQIKTIRISAWRGKDASTEFYLRDIRQTGVLGQDASIAILRAESVMRQSPEETRSVEQFTQTVAQHLYALNIGCATLSDLEVSSRDLSAAKLVVLPYNPSLPAETTEKLQAYLKDGGKVMAFYLVPEALRPLLGVRGGNHVKAANPGNFSTIRFRDGALAGAPPTVGQQSWNIEAFQPIPGTSHVLAEWFDDKGQPTGYPAIIASSNGMVMTHVLLTDDAANKRRMVMAMAGALAPEVWRQAADASLAHIGVINGFSTYDRAVREIAQLSPGNPRLTNALALAQSLRQSAIALAAQSKFADSMEKSAAASLKVKEAFCLAQKPLPGEFRAFWCHSAFGVQGMDWDQAVRRLADNGFNAILPNMLWGGAAFYPSKILPVASAVTNRGDQIAQCLAACRKHGVKLHVWKVNWNLGQAVPEAFVEKMRRANRLQASSNGKEERWLCPSHPDNQKLEVDSLVEIVRNYEVDGIHFDYIRYPDSDHCFCVGCQARFQRATGVKVQSWPKDALAGGPLRQPWLEWRRSNITAVVKAVSEQARAVKPKIKLSAAVFTNWAADRDGVGQDWKLWCDRRYVDFVCPMDYTPSNGSFENMIARQIEWAGRTPCYPGIGVSASSSHFGADRVIEQINITRSHHTGGFIIFNYGVAESKDLLPLLGMGITAKR
jgi:uncharacterized lipoprotein YddW (UPF0748 family)